MSIGSRARTLAFTALAAALLAGCGDSDPGTDIVASAEPDQALGEAIVAELDEYNDGFDLSSLPADAQAELAPIVNNLPPAGGGVKTLTVTGGVVEAQTDFAADAEGEETGHLICGAIYRAIVGSDPGGHRVVGADGAVLADCEPRDANFP